MGRESDEFTLHSAEQQVAILRDVKVGGRMSLRQAFSAMPCHHFDSRINDSHFDYPKLDKAPSKDELRKIGVVLVSLREDVRRGRIEDILKADGLEYLSFQESVDFLTDERSWNLGQLFVFPGVPFEPNQSCPDATLVPVVHQFLTNYSSNPNLSIQKRFKRFMDLDRVGRIWPGGAVFPAKIISS